MTDYNLNEEIEKELKAEEEALMLKEFEPKKIGKSQVTGAKFVWMFIAIGIDLITAYALVKIMNPLWYYAALWIIAGAGGLLFAEWLWERIGNNDEQVKIANTSKTVSALAVVIMALASGVAVIMEWQGLKVMEIGILFVTVGLVCFHGWQAYQYHEKDDDYIAQTLDALADAKNEKEIKSIHRAGRRVTAKKTVYNTGERYQKIHGGAFKAAAGRSFGKDTDTVRLDEKNPPTGG